MAKSSPPFPPVLPCLPLKRRAPQPSSQVRFPFPSLPRDPKSAPPSQDPSSDPAVSRLSATPPNELPGNLPLSRAPSLGTGLQGPGYLSHESGARLPTPHRAPGPTVAQNSPLSGPLPLPPPPPPCLTCPQQLPLWLLPEIFPILPSKASGTTSPSPQQSPDC